MKKQIVNSIDCNQLAKRNTQKGITLIALIITIIILLILAVVSINLVVNQGIINKTKYAVDKHNEAQTNESEGLREIEKEYFTTKLKELSTEELNQLQTDNDGYIIAEQGDCKVYCYMFFSTQFVGVEKGSNMYMYTFVPIAGAEKDHRWYTIEEGGEFVEYKGTAPISLDDFDEENIYLKSYLEQVISSF